LGLEKVGNNRLQNAVLLETKKPTKWPALGGGQINTFLSFIRTDFI